MLQSVIEYYRVLQSIAKYYRVLQNIIEYYRVYLAHLLAPLSWLVFHMVHMPKTLWLDLWHNGINFKQPKLQAALAQVLDELERTKKKGKSSKYNFQDDGHISSCPVVHV